ncbi:MAG: helix-turn-helix domain-containing protein, partial [Phycisphaerae bacterium]|nr:helix-turn-helix domain-containing protein [Phycisphaerae bacterium]
RPTKTKAGRKRAKAKRKTTSKTATGKRAAKAVKASKAKKKTKAARSAGNARTGKTKKTKTQSAPFKPTGAAVKRLRKQLGLSVAEFAEAAGVTTASVYRWEKVRGKLRLQPRTLRALTQLKDRQ